MNIYTHTQTAKLTTTYAVSCNHQVISPESSAPNPDPPLHPAYLEVGGCYLGTYTFPDGRVARYRCQAYFVAASGHTAMSLDGGDIVHGYYYLGYCLPLGRLTVFLTG